MLLIVVDDLAPIDCFLPLIEGIDIMMSCHPREIHISDGYSLVYASSPSN